MVWQGTGKRGERSRAGNAQTLAERVQHTGLLTTNWRIPAEEGKRSGGRTRTYNQLVNSQLLCLIELHRNKAQLYTSTHLTIRCQCFPCRLSVQDGRCVGRAFDFFGLSAYSDSLKAMAVSWESG
jgi:hypothetical protein